MLFFEAAFAITIPEKENILHLQRLLSASSSIKFLHQTSSNPTPLTCGEGKVVYLRSSSVGKSKLKLSRQLPSLGIEPQPLVIHSDALLTELTWHMLIEGYKFNFIFVGEPIDFWT